MIGADTSFLIDFLKGEKNAVAWMVKNHDFLCLCENVVYEFLCGNLTEHQTDQFLAFISQFPVFVFNRDAALKSSNMYRGAKKRGKTASHPDVMIAGTYLAHSVQHIVTRNIKHFVHISIKTVAY